MTALLNVSLAPAAWFRRHERVTGTPDILLYSNPSCNGQHQTTSPSKFPGSSSFSRLLPEPSKPVVSRQHVTCTATPTAHGSFKTSSGGPMGGGMPSELTLLDDILSGAGPAPAPEPLEQDTFEPQASGSDAEEDSTLVSAVRQLQSRALSSRRSSRPWEPAGGAGSRQQGSPASQDPVPPTRGSKQKAKPAAGRPGRSHVLQSPDGAAASSASGPATLFPSGSQQATPRLQQRPMRPATGASSTSAAAGSPPAPSPLLDDPLLQAAAMAQAGTSSSNSSSSSSPPGTIRRTGRAFLLLDAGPLHSSAALRTSASSGTSSSNRAAATSPSGDQAGTAAGPGPSSLVVSSRRVRAAASPAAAASSKLQGAGAQQAAAPSPPGSATAAVTPAGATVAEVASVRTRRANRLGARRSRTGGRGLQEAATVTPVPAAVTGPTPSEPLPEMQPLQQQQQQRAFNGRPITPMPSFSAPVPPPSTPPSDLPAFVDGSNWRLHAAARFPEVYDVHWHASLYEFLVDLWPVVGRAHGRAPGGSEGVRPGSGRAAAAEQLVVAAYQLLHLCHASPDARVVHVALLTFVDSLADHEEMLEGCAARCNKELLAQLLAPLLRLLHPDLYPEFLRLARGEHGEAWRPRRGLPPRWLQLLEALADLQAAHPAVDAAVLVYLLESANVE